MQRPQCLHSIFLHSSNFFNCGWSINGSFFLSCLKTGIRVIDSRVQRTNSKSWCKDLKDIIWEHHKNIDARILPLP